MQACATDLTLRQGARSLQEGAGAFSNYTLLVLRLGDGFVYAAGRAQPLFVDELDVANPERGVYQSRALNTSRCMLAAWDPARTPSRTQWDYSGECAARLAREKRGSAIIPNPQAVP